MPTRRLPSDPSTEHLKKQAKVLLRQFRAGDAEARALVHEFHPKDPAVLSLVDAQLALARSYGFPSWPRLAQHMDEVARYYRAPHRRTAEANPPDELLRLACLTYGDDTPARRDEALRLVAECRELATANIHTMAATGSLDAAAAALAAHPSLANAEGGPFGWAPLMYLAYSRLDGPDSVEVARLLLRYGADPNVGYLWEGLPSPFTALTGVLGGGESNQPPHRDRLRLAALLLDAGADPNDSQAVYHFTLVGDHDAALELLLSHGLGRGDGGPWHRRMGSQHPTPAQLLEDLLLHAATDDLRAWLGRLLEHGVDVNGLGTEHPLRGGHTAYELAMLSGNREIADRLRAAGARVNADPVLDFVAHAMRAEPGDPELRERAVAEHPRLVGRAVELGRVEAVRRLVSLGFPVNPPGRSSPLHEAAWRGDLAMVRALLDLGADPDATDSEHESTPHGWAEYAGQREVADFLSTYIQT